MNAVLGACIADAATRPLHWIYNVDNLKSYIKVFYYTWFILLTILLPFSKQLKIFFKNRTMKVNLNFGPRTNVRFIRFQPEPIVVTSI